MIRCVIKPTLRENATLTGLKARDNTTQYKTSMIISDIPLKKHSFFVYIEEFYQRDGDVELSHLRSGFPQNWKFNRWTYY